jgi:putative peptidoglycan lipid II flippase
LGEPVIRLFFERNQFTAESTSSTAYALVFFAIGLAGHATVEIVDRVFYALHDTRSPVLVAVGAIALNVVLSLVLMRTPLNFGGLALANSIAALVEGLVLIRLITRRLPDVDIPGLSSSALRMLAASLVMGLPVAWLAQALEPVLGTRGTPGQALLLALCVTIGALLYALASVAFRSDELHALYRLLRRR